MGPSPDSSETFHDSPDWWFLLTVGRLAPGISDGSGTGDRAAGRSCAQRTRRSGAPAQGRDSRRSLSFTSARGMMGLRDQYRQPLQRADGDGRTGAAHRLRQHRHAARGEEFGPAARVQPAHRARRQRRPAAAPAARRKARCSWRRARSLGWFIALWATRALAVLSELEVELAPDATVFALHARALDSWRRSSSVWRRCGRAHNVPLGLVLKSSVAQHDRRPRAGAWDAHRSGGQVALCVALLVGAGLLVRTLQNLNAADLGLRTRGAVRLRRQPPASSEASDDAVVQFYQALMERRAGAAGRGVGHAHGQSHRLGLEQQHTAVVDGAAPTGCGTADALEQRRARLFPRAGHTDVCWGAISPKPICSGRRRDRQRRVRARLSRRSVGDRPHRGVFHPPGSRRFIDHRRAPPTAATPSVRESTRPMAYFLYSHVPAMSELHIEVRASGDPARLAPDIRRIMTDLGPDLPLIRPMTQQAQFAQSYRNERLFSRLAAAFGVSRGGARRDRPLRHAVVSRHPSHAGDWHSRGARRAPRSRRVDGRPRQPRSCASRASLLGLPLAFAGSRFLESMLFGLTTRDPLSYVGALVAVRCSTAIASFVPARRAASVDPMIALRSE